MTEKSKNDQKRKRSYRKIAAGGCLVLMLIGCLGIAVIMARFDAWHNVYGSAIDYCAGQLSNVHADFQLAGRVVDEQGKAFERAVVKLDSKNRKYCDDAIASYSTNTNASGEFSFGPDLFEYEKEFFISVSADGCHTSVIYDDLASSEPIMITLDCTTPSSH